MKLNEMKEKNFASVIRIQGTAEFQRSFPWCTRRTILDSLITA